MRWSILIDFRLLFNEQKQNRHFSMWLSRSEFILINFQKLYKNSFRMFVNKVCAFRNSKYLSVNDPMIIQYLIFHSKNALNYKCASNLVRRKVKKFARHCSRTTNELPWTFSTYLGCNEEFNQLIFFVTIGTSCCCKEEYFTRNYIY